MPGSQSPRNPENPSLYPATFHNAGARGANLRNPTPLGVWRVQLTKDDAERDIQSEKKREKLYDALTHRAIIWDIPEEKINQIYRILFDGEEEK